jgi:ATP adenylyltransferase
MVENYLWTPWRMQYIAGTGKARGEQAASSGQQAVVSKQEDELTPMEMPECVFCDRVALPPERDRESLILLRADRSFIILNLYPYNSGHLMVVPYKHTADFAGLEAAVVNEIMELVQRMVRVIEAEYSPQGFNIGMNLGRVAGAGVADHVHMHLVPRWAGDTNFMPIVGQTKVMPELLETTYDRLKGRLTRIE